MQPDRPEHEAAIDHAKSIESDQEQDMVAPQTDHGNMPPSLNSASAAISGSIALVNTLQIPSTTGKDQKIIPAAAPFKPCLIFETALSYRRS
jgi:hypothetical protein